jgi:ABC-type transport system substrate-binding protein
MEWDLAIYFYTSKPLVPTGDSDIFYCDSIPSVDNPEGWNMPQFCDPEYEELDTQIASMLPGPERDALIQEAILRVHEAYFWIGLRERVTWWAVNGARFDVGTIEPYVGTLGDDFSMVQYWQPAQ